MVSVFSFHHLIGKPAWVVWGVWRSPETSPAWTGSLSGSAWRSAELVAEAALLRCLPVGVFFPFSLVFRMKVFPEGNCYAVGVGVCSCIDLFSSRKACPQVERVQEAGRGGLPGGACASRAVSRPSVLQTSKRVGKALHASLQSVLHKEESLGPKRQKVGFLG